MKRKLIIGSLVSAVFLYLAFRGIQWETLWDVLKKTRFIYLLPAVLSTVLQLYFRGYRWKFMLAPVKRIPTLNLFSATSIGYMANNLLPARLGEIVRAYVLGKQEQISKTASFATIVYERVIDVFALLVILWVTLLKVAEPDWLRRSGWGLLVLNVALFVAIIVIEKRRAQFSRLVGRAVRRLPDRSRERIQNVADAFASGLAAAGSLRTMVPVLLTSLLVWFTTVVGVYYCFGALNMDVPLLATFTIVAFVAFGSMIPSAPAYVGTTQYACVIALAFYGVDKNQALAYSLLYHASIFFPVTILGLAFLWSTHMRFQELSRTS